VDYSSDYPQKTGKVLCRVSYAELRTGEVTVAGRKVAVGSMSSYARALEIAGILADEIRRGEFLLASPSRRLPVQGTFKGLQIRGQHP
jgi:uncharacterized protein (DUF39 family)